MEERDCSCVLVKQKIAELDTEGLWPYHLPEVAATENELTDVEKAIGHRLDDRYRQFLSFANGWKGFYQCVDLFGSNDLLGGARLSRAQELLGSLAPIEAACGITQEECLPIAVSEDDIDVFFIADKRSGDPGAIYWFAGTLIERFDNFDEFFLSMIDLNRVRLQAFQQGNESV